MAESMQLASRLGRMARAGQGVLAGHGAELSTSHEDDVRRRRRGSTTRPGGKRYGRRRRVGSGAAAETGCGVETTRDAGRADGAAGRG